MKLLKTVLAGALVAIATPVLAQQQLSIATGGTGGVYYPMGGGLAEVINNHIEGYAATAEVTGASVENMGLIATGDADLALGLADTVAQAYSGTGRFEGQQLPMIRGLASMYANMVQIVTLDGSGISSLADLRGKRVSVGAPGSGTEINAAAILSANGISYDDIEEQRLNFNETADALANGDIDAGFWSVGAPTSSILNLATNARDAMLSHDNGGKLTIRTARTTGADAHAKGFKFVEDGEYMLIEVEDTGHGMSKDVMEKIFQPFFTTKEAGVGTGLGLATVYGIIKQSGGYVCTTSAVGKGTTFHIYLPALKAEEVPVPVEPTAADKATVRPMDISGRGRILLIEDEDGVRGIAASLLRSRGYEVEEACDGEEAMEILEDNPNSFDLVISDVVMPGKDGPTLIREAKDLLGHARVIFISGYAERDIAQQLDDDRAVSFLPKPFTVRQLAERVKQELGSPSKEAA